jgi:hypothetical protein
MDERHLNIYSVVQGFPSMNPKTVEHGHFQSAQHGPSGQNNDGALFGYALNVRIL